MSAWRGTTPTQWSTKVTGMARRIVFRTATMAFGSIKWGSTITGAPGQPVDLGILRASWILAFEASGLAIISTNIVYAPDIEEGMGSYGALTLRSQVGGFHSVKLTVAGFQRLVDAAILAEQQHG